MMTTGILSNYTKPPSKDSDKDPTGLGRWCSLVVKGSSGPVRPVTYYRPNRPTKMEADISRGLEDSQDANKVSLSVWAQHKRYFKSAGRQHVDLRTEADNDLLTHLRKWRANNEEIILMGDFNQNIYTSQFA